MAVRTVVIIDFPRCGSSMTAGVLEILGVPMVGTNYDPYKLEDIDIQKSLYMEPDEDKFASIVAERSARNEIWGWKCLGGWKFADWYAKYLVDPVYIAIYKDPVSVTRGRYRAMGISKIHSTFANMYEGLRGILDNKMPTRFLSYQTAIVDPRLFVTSIADIIQVQVADDAIERAVGYISPTDGIHTRSKYPSVEEFMPEGILNA
jgi:hypothetical protein